ncbi:unnamed protein product [Psylliodes chrysocephalus]|uniref:Transforming acidic coiled-coil-containing protein C-terminal domain-containing protein n=1 Tax=Psylliodes chrysocephalus TaxID=3402493 RepID=A0A9P0CK52_9CUCU|nr:unnamed protein product [Psylliodes chrysocephala]
MDILKIFRMQEPVSKGMLSKKEEVGQFKEVLQEKEFLIKNNEERIKELENEISDLKETNHSLECRLKASSLDENGFQEVMLSYDDFFKKIWIDREEVVNKNNVMDTYLQNLEFSYNGLLEKFEKAKEIIYGLKNNQDLLKEELEEYKEVIEVWEKRYEGLKAHSETTLADANKELGDKEKENLQEVSKLKTKILQRQAKIIELEKMLKHDLKPSIYAPLRNRIKSK